MLLQNVDKLKKFNESFFLVLLLCLAVWVCVVNGERDCNYLRRKDF